MDQKELQEHVFGTYISLRRGMTWIGALLPFVLYGIGAACGIRLAGSMSEYYWAAAGDFVPARNVFVGGLFAVAACLWLYKGFSSKENVALNFAALFAVGVALVPMADPKLPPDGKFSVHGACGVLLFLCLAFVMWFCKEETLQHLPAEEARSYRRKYNVLGLVMLASPLSAFVANAFFRAGDPGSRNSFVFWVEAIGIAAFAFYWQTKSQEFKRSNALGKAAAGRLHTSPPGLETPAPAPAPAVASPAPA